jgi:hypothetical protein
MRCSTLNVQYVLRAKGRFMQAMSKAKGNCFFNFNLLLKLTPPELFRL